jgi:hypothetical protein
MMNKVFLTAALLIASFCVSLSQGTEQSGLKNEDNFEYSKWSVGFDMNFGEMEAKPSANLSLSGSMAITESILIGVKGTAVWYDHRLNKLDAERTYHVESGYAGATIEKLWSLFDNFRISLSAYVASGFLQYKYDSKYNAELTWTEEIIDKETFHVFEPGISFTYMLSRNVGLSANVNYRMTSEIKLIETEDNFMNQANFGLGIKYNF